MKIWSDLEAEIPIQEMLDRLNKAVEAGMNTLVVDGFNMGAEWVSCVKAVRKEEKIQTPKL